MLTKRRAVLAGVAGTIGLLSGRAKTEPRFSSSGTTTWKQEPQTVHFDLDTFASFTFTHGDDKITVTGKEIFEALKG